MWSCGDFHPYRISHNNRQQHTNTSRRTLVFKPEKPRFDSIRWPCRWVNTHASNMHPSICDSIGSPPQKDAYCMLFNHRPRNQSQSVCWVTVLNSGSVWTWQLEVLSPQHTIAPPTFSRDRASSMPNRASPFSAWLNSISGMAMLLSCTRPPRLFCGKNEVW